MESDPGHHIAQTGGYACSECGRAAKVISLRCSHCTGNLLHGLYHLKCACDPRPSVTRAGSRAKRFIVSPSLN